MGEGNSFSLLVCPHPGEGPYPGQVQMGGTYPGWGGGYLPWPGADGGRVPTLVGTPPARIGTLPPARIGTLSQGRYPQPGYVPTLPGQISIANTCCMAGGIPLAFTQGEFLVFCF